jgi:uncharacterized protein with GYD domain
MLFVTTVKFIPGKCEEATRSIRRPKIPKEIKIREFLGLFGKPDVAIIFEAPNEKAAADFTVQFGRYGDLVTSLALPIEEFKWTL